MLTCLPDNLLAADTVGRTLQLHDLPTLQNHPVRAFQAILDAEIVHA